MKNYHGLTSFEIRNHIFSMIKIIERYKNYTYIVLGKGGPSGKSWITRSLRDNDLHAVEITENLLGFVEYKDDDNHMIWDDYHETCIIILNKVDRNRKENR